MKKIITLSLFSLISIAHASSKPFSTCISTNNFKSKSLLTSANLKPINAYFNFTIKKACKGTLVVVDETGIVVLTQQVKLIAGKNKITVEDITSLKEGNYTFNLTTSHKTYSTAFVLWK